MLIHVINPNSTASMTDAIANAARGAAAPGTRLLVQNPKDNPPSLEGAADEALAVPAMLAAISAAELEGAQAHVIACFDDPGLHAAREIATRPVIGLCQAAIQTAMILAGRFTIITTLPRAIPRIEDLAARYGAGRTCAGVRAIDCPVLGLEENPEAAIEAMSAEITRAKVQDRAEAIILGCAGMVTLGERLAARHDIPVLDGVSCAVRLAQALAGGGVMTSKIATYAPPRMKTPIAFAHRVML